ncbi:lipopolysaccharide assembly protein A [Frankia sp. AiPs1]|uniref:LapA family protein n=1 Tax=Frankia sp. AiPa1 TaxID=573492 RepID=UPI00202B7AAC|nr:lipopolysaccharide assembly protein LapA domain-containing protein [Frankia sp. AiPa1]MCL9762185.1 lipopolysaccharide assembly protein LapA domain-containing protein [Frankia sp. AiPa1]
MTTPPRDLPPKGGAPQPTPGPGSATGPLTGPPPAGAPAASAPPAAGAPPTGAPPVGGAFPGSAYPGSAYPGSAYPDPAPTGPPAGQGGPISGPQGTPPGSGSTGHHSRFGRGGRPDIPVTRTSRVWTTLVLFALVLIVLLIFILQNLDDVKVSFLGAHGTMPLAVAMLFAAVAGALLVAIPGVGRMIQLRRTVRRTATQPPVGTTATDRPLPPGTGTSADGQQSPSARTTTAPRHR